MIMRTCTQAVLWYLMGPRFGVCISRSPISFGHCQLLVKNLYDVLQLEILYMRSFNRHVYILGSVETCYACGKVLLVNNIHILVPTTPGFWLKPGIFISHYNEISNSVCVMYTLALPCFPLCVGKVKLIWSAAHTAFYSIY